jgi:LysR family pca operon transcriptional activator
MLEVRDLVLVRAIADHGSLARAARVLAVGQPALTRSLAGLEGKLRGQLFERNRRGVVPTDLCRALLAEAGEILARLEQLDRHLAEVRSPRTETLTVIAGTFTAETVAIAAAARMPEVQPGTRLRFTAANWAEVPRAIRECEAAIGIVDLGELGEAPDLLVEPLQTLPGVFVVRPGHPLTKQGPPLTLARIVAWPLISPGRMPRSMQEPLVLAREQAREAGLVHPAFPALILESPTLAQLAVQGSDAVAAVTVAIAERAVRAGLVVALPWRAPWMAVRHGILRLRGRRQTEAEAAFLDLLRGADREAGIGSARFLAEFGFQAVPA